jgi:hypothetical protein
MTIFREGENYGSQQSKRAVKKILTAEAVYL